ncbi:MAG: carboxypeptidase-like regulatory domain-containing protein [Ginsengibacter sp.]
MKLTVFLLSLIFFSSYTFAQSEFYTVTGKVIDKNSTLPLAGASVFAQNTTFGVATDAEGNFKLKLPNGGYELTVTFTGYETESIRITTSSVDNKNMIIEVKPKEKSMEEVSIVATSEVKDGWQKYGSFFTENFIGKTQTSRQCVIKNPEVLRFFFSRKRNRLKVITNEPLVVMNNALGYKITFAIDSFTYEYANNTSQFTGYPLFEELQGTTEQQAGWKQNRMQAYLGSQLHFMRSLYDKTIDEEGFEVQFIITKNGRETPIPLKNIYSALNYLKDDSTSTVEFKPNQPEIAIIFNNEKPEQAYIDLDPKANKNFQVSTLNITPGESIIIEENGYYYDQKDIITNDYWGFKKVGDMLPYDYDPEPDETPSAKGE